MKNIIRILLIIIVFHTLGNAVSIESIFLKPEISDVTLSLDGKYIAAIFTDSTDQQQLLTVNISTGAQHRYKPASGYDVWEYEWAGNDRIVYKIVADKMYFKYLASTDRNCTATKLLVAWETTSVINGMPADSNYVMVWRYFQPNYSIFGSMNVHTGRIKKKERIRNPILWVKTDNYSVVPNLMCIYKRNSGGSGTVLFRESRDVKWRPLPVDERDYSYYYTPPFDNTKIYVTSYNGQKTKALYLYNTVTDTLEKLIYSDSVFNIEGHLCFFNNPFNPRSAASLRSIFYNTQYSKTVWFDPELEKVQRKIDGKLPQTINYLYTADTGLSRFLVNSFSDVVPNRYYVYDRKVDSLYPALQSMPWINPDSLSRTESVSFYTRDSLYIYGYLTTPKNKTAPFPLVVLLHGGPHARDYGGFDPEVHSLAVHGYAVFRINYRGSKGFNYTISEQEEFNFGKMYLDVIDGTKYLIDKGIADRKRIAVMGTSFGGYLSLCCVANEPGMYRCVISNAGIFDWKKHVRSKLFTYNNYVYDYFKSNLDTSDTTDVLRDISPIHKAKNIKVPVLLAGGMEDNNVSISQSYKLYQKLSSNGVAVETFFKGGEGHGFEFQKNLVAYYNKVVDFLNRNMKPTAVGK